MKNQAGEVLSDNVKNRWEDYSERLINEENEWLDKNTENIGLVRIISMDEVKVFINRMKNEKAVAGEAG